MTDIEALRLKLNKELGPDTVRLASDPYFVVRLLPTGVLPLDILLGGGFPVGRSIEIYGDYSSLKSWLALVGIANTQRNGGKCALIDTEHAFDPEWARECGVDVESLIVVHPTTGEEAIAVTEILTRDGVDLIVWDSVASAQPQAEAEKKPGEDKQPARRASMMSKGLSRMTAVNAQTTALVFINQTRTNVGMTFGSSEVVPGGKALAFYASMRLRMGKAGKITRDVTINDGTKPVTSKEVIGYKIKATLEKSKLNKPHREMWFTFDLERGAIDIPGWYLTQGEDLGIVTKPTKGWFSIPELYEGNMRRADVLAAIEEDEETRAYFEDAIRKAHGLV